MSRELIGEPLHTEPIVIPGPEEPVPVEAPEPVREPERVPG